MELSAAAIAAAEAAAEDASVDAVVDLIDAGASNGYVEIRSGAQPADPDVGATGTLLATLTCNDPAFGNSSGGTATANAVTGDASADATGTASWFRVYDSDDTPIIDGGITDTSGEDMVIDTTSITIGDPVSITSWTASASGTATAT